MRRLAINLAMVLALLGISVCASPAAEAPANVLENQYLRVDTTSPYNGAITRIQDKKGTADCVWTRRRPKTSS